MAWIYLTESMDYRSSPESEVLTTHSKTTCDQSPIAKSTVTVKECSCPGCTMAIWELPQYGTISKPLTENSCEKLSTSLSAASRRENDHARTLALQDMEKAWMESEAVFIGKSIAWPKKSSPHLYSLKTFPRSDPEEDLKSLEVLPKSGMTLGFACYPLQDAEHRTAVKDGGCLPTPQQRDYKGASIKMDRLPDFVNRLLPTPKAKIGHDCPSERRRHQPSLECLVAIGKLLPISQACDATKAARFSATGKKLNPLFVAWMLGYPLTWMQLEPWVIPFVSRRQRKRSNT